MILRYEMDCHERKYRSKTFLLAIAAHVLYLTTILPIAPIDGCYAIGAGCTGPGCMAKYPSYCAYRYCGAAASSAAARQARGVKLLSQDNDLGRVETWDVSSSAREHQSDNSAANTPLPETPDELFVQCCKAWDLPTGCIPKCNYRNYTADALRSMFLRYDGCPLEAATIIHYCSSQNRDHRLCCERNGVLGTGAGQKCSLFCEPMPKDAITLDYSYLSCLDKFQEIKRCFFEDALREVDYLEMDAELGNNLSKLSE